MNAMDDISIKQKIELYFDRLWPINRSISGPGFRQSLDILDEIMPTKRFKFETGSKVLDWLVPMEWLARDAYFIDSDGHKRAEFKRNNLHLMGYSVPINETLTLAELQPHLYSIPEMPDAIPYVTSYYKENWGFCLSHNERQSLPDGQYQVCIDTELYPGFVEIGEAVLEGKTKQEVLFSTYLCHPSMANNELSGPLAMACLYERVKAMPERRYTYRFVVVPETIGAICYLSLRGEYFKKNLAAGYVMTCLGDSGPFTYKLSRRANTLADHAAKIILRDIESRHSVVPFNPGVGLNGGSDEKHYCWPGFNLPVGSLMRTMYGCYKQYHTSLDNKEFISFDALVESVDTYFSIVKALEANFTWENTIKNCMPQLGRRGLFPSVSSESNRKSQQDKLSAMLWLLNLADGQHDLLEIADKSGCKLEWLIKTAKKLSAAELIKEVSPKAKKIRSLLINRFEGIMA